MTDTAELIARADEWLRCHAPTTDHIVRTLRDALAGQAQEPENTSAMRTIYEVLAERDAIEAATIARCAKVADATSHDEEVTGGQGRAVGACLEIGHRIRALEPTAVPPDPAASEREG
jgi:hypothetical protein